METGYDILFFWVARMIMSGLAYTGQAPFHTVYLHGIVRDGDGRKMSKTYGNVMDPRWVMDGATNAQIRTSGTSADIADRYPNGIPAMGTDALRFTLLTSGTPGNDTNLSLEKVESNRNFANKIWNITRFIVTNLPEGFQRSAVSGQSSALADRWILARLNQTIASATRLIDNYDFGQAGNQIYDFLWSDFADWYVEIAKITLQGSDEAAKQRVRDILLHGLDMTLRLLHPYVPFITEAVWQKLPRRADDGPALIIARWPEAGAVDEAALDDFEHLRALIRGIRNVRAEKKVDVQKRIAATLAAGDKAAWLNEQRALFITLAKVDEARLSITAHLAEKPKNAIALVEGSTEVFLPLEGLVDVGVERDRLKKELADVDRQIAKSEGLLGSDFVNKAPAALVEKERAKLAQLQDSRARVQARLGEL
jgi:valyl-tRNA synthetase